MVLSVRLAAHSDYAGVLAYAIVHQLTAAESTSSGGLGKNS